MSKGFVLGEMGHIVNVLPSQDVSGGKVGQRFSMRNHSHASIIVAIGASASAAFGIVVRKAALQVGGVATAIPFSYYPQEVAAGDVQGPRTAALAAGITPSGNDNINYVIELDAAELGEGTPWVEVAITAGVVAIQASIIAVLSGGRYSGGPSVVV